MHDWLKEYHPDFVHIAPKTVYNFVMALRQKYNIPLEEVGREYFVVEELPYGQQAQADFGHYILRGTEDRRKRIHFFVMMLSRSRMKFVQFSDAPFTTRTAIDAHEEAFRFFSGIPSEVVYDQDRLLLVEERMGELLLTREFKDYVFEQEFQLHFCRKADPQSKGKVENVVKYVKNNFLYARPWYDLQTLQAQAMAWLQRTGNAMPHSTTRKIPLEEWQNEQPHLRPWVSVKILPSYILRTVRKDNTLAYLGNFYSVPQGTFKTKDTMVMIWLKEEELHVHDTEGVFLCKHAIAESKGNTVINTDHKRDKSLKLKALLIQTASLFLNPGLAMQYFEMIRKERGRYLRAGLYLILNTFSYDAKYYFPEKNGWSITGGLNGMYQNNDVTKGTEFVIPSYNQFDIGPFIFVKKSMDKLEVAGGIRYDVRQFNNQALFTKPDPVTGFDKPVSATDTAGADNPFYAYKHTFAGMSGSLGLSYRFSDHFTGKANIGRGYRSPNISEISANGVHPGTNSFQKGNLNFKPEFNWQEDIGVNYISQHVTIDAGVFDNNINNYIYNQKVSSSSGQTVIDTFQFQAAKAHLYGGELSIDIHPHPWDWLHFENSLSLVYGNNEGVNSQKISDSAKYLPFIPPLHTFSELRQTLKKCLQQL